MGLFHHLGHRVADEERPDELAPEPPAPEPPPPGGAAVGGGVPTGEVRQAVEDRLAAERQHAEDVARADRERREDQAREAAWQAEQRQQWAKENAAAAAPAADAAAASSPYPIPPAQQRAIEAGTPAGPGGVVPYEGGGVRVGMPRSDVQHTLGAKAVKRK